MSAWEERALSDWLAYGDPIPPRPSPEDIEAAERLARRRPSSRLTARPASNASGASAYGSHGWDHLGARGTWTPATPDTRPRNI